MSTPTAPGSTGYGVDIYGTILYGASQQRTFSVEPVLISQTDYGRLSLSWQSPRDETWRRLRLVRNTDGFPSTPDDGTVVLEATMESIRTSFEDVGLEQGYIYYYTVFMSQEAPEWSSSEYPVGAIVQHDGAYWLCISESNIGHEPEMGSGFWVATVYKPQWYPAGTTAALAIKNQGYTERLYNRTPQPYKIITSDLFSNIDIDNPMLFKFLSLFGFALNDIKTEYDNLLLLNDSDYVSSANLDKLGKQFGVETDYISSPRLRRARVRNVSTNYRLKGTEQSIYNAIASVAGWTSDIEIGYNKMLGPDQAMFESLKHKPWQSGFRYYLNDFVTYNGYQYKCLATTTTLSPPGGGTSDANWQVQLNVLEDVTLRNPATRGVSTWVGGFFGPAGTYTAEYFQIHGVQNPLSGSDFTTNGMAYRIVTGSPITGITGLQSVGRIVASPWSNATNYVINEMATVGVLYYKALKPSGPGTPYGPITPGTNDAFWTFETFNNFGPAGRAQFVKDTTPLPLMKTWNTVFEFKAGEEVEYNGKIYIALEDTVNYAPSGSYTSNKIWQYDRPAEQAFTSSHYSRRMTSATNVLANSNIIWYDDDGNEMLQSRLPTAATQFVRFDSDYANLNGNTDNQLGQAWVGVPTATTLWESVNGQARVNPESFQALGSKPKYTYIHLADTRENAVLAFTYGVDYEDTTNFENGVLFRRTGTNFWFMTRTRLVLYNGGVETVKATWPRISDWDRVRITILNNRVTVEKYFRSSTPSYQESVSLLADVFDSTLGSPVSGYGIIQRYAPGV